MTSLKLDAFRIVCTIFLTRILTADCDSANSDTVRIVHEFAAHHQLASISVFSPAARRGGRKHELVKFYTGSAGLENNFYLDANADICRER